MIFQGYGVRNNMIRVVLSGEEGGGDKSIKTAKSINFSELFFSAAKMGIPV